MHFLRNRVLLFFEKGCKSFSNLSRGIPLSLLWECIFGFTNMIIAGIFGLSKGTTLCSQEKTNSKLQIQDYPISCPRWGVDWMGVFFFQNYSFRLKYSNSIGLLFVFCVHAFSLFIFHFLDLFFITVLKRRLWIKAKRCLAFRKSPEFLHRRGPKL